MAAKGNYLYVSLLPYYPDSSTALFYVVDGSDPANPKTIGSTIGINNYGGIYGLALYSHYAYVDSYHMGLVVLDVSNPNAPKVLATYDTLATIPKGISGSHLYGVGYGLDYLSLYDPVHPKREGSLTNAPVSDLVAPWDETRCIFVDYNTYQINLADFSIPTSPRIVACSSPTDLWDLAFCNGSLFGVLGKWNPAILRFTWDDRDSICLAGEVTLPGWGARLAVSGNRLVVGGAPRSDNSNLYLLSAIGPQSPYVVGECLLPGSPYHLKADGNRIYADLGDGNLVVVEVTEH